MAGDQLDCLHPVLRSLHVEVDIELLWVREQLKRIIVRNQDTELFPENFPFRKLSQQEITYLFDIIRVSIIRLVQIPFNTTHHPWDDAEDWPFADLAGNLDFPTHLLDDVFADWKAEATAWGVLVTVFLKVVEVDK